MKKNIFLLLFLFLNGCINSEIESKSCLYPEELPQQYINGQPLYKISGHVYLCNNATYNLPFIIQGDNSYLNCDGAIIQVSEEYDRSAISSTGYSNILIKDCIVKGSSGSGINISSGNNNSILNVVVKGTEKNGITFRSTNSRIENSIVYNNAKVGIYVERDSYSNSIFGNVIYNNGLSGIVLDAAYENDVFSNMIWDNKHGISLYRNCGEHGKEPRMFEASRNYLHDNVIYGHIQEDFVIGRNYDDSHDIKPGAGIVVGLRQGKTLRAQQDWSPSGEPIALCNDDSYERKNWQTLEPESLIPPVLGGRMYLVQEQYSDKPDRHFDFAPDTDIYNNEIYDNDIGIVVTDQETRVVGNSFHSNGFTDIFVGNKYFDNHVKNYGLRYIRAFHSNWFSSFCLTTSEFARSAVYGSDKTQCSKYYYTKSL